MGLSLAFHNRTVSKQERVSTAKCDQMKVMVTLTQSDIPSLLQRYIWEKKSLGPGHTQGEGTRESLEQWSRLQSSGVRHHGITEAILKV